MPDKSSTREIIVTGAHRSGTSAISNFLVNLGVDVGSSEMLLKQAQDNQKGFFERLDVMRINDGILQCVNSSWHDLDLTILSRPEQLTVTEEIKEEIQNILKSFPDNHLPFLLKDPRFSLTLPVWLEYFSRPTIIVCLRNPLEIARSLQKRNGFSIYKSLSIWETYLCSLYQHSKNLRYIIVNFNHLLDNPEKYGERLMSQLNDSGIQNSQPLEKAIHSSFDISLKHEECSDQELESILSVRQMKLWQELKKDHDVCDISKKYQNLSSSEPMRQKDTDIGYSRLEIQLATKFTDDFHTTKVESQLVARKETFLFEINSHKVHSFKLAPLNRPCVIKFISFEVITQKGTIKRVNPTSMNGLFDSTLDWYYFPQENPSICYNSPFAEVATIRISILFASLDLDTVKQLLIDFLVSRDKRHTKQLTQTTQAEKKKDLLLHSLIYKEGPSAKTTFDRQLLSVYHLAKTSVNPKEFWRLIKYNKLLAKDPSLFSPDFYCNTYKDVNSSTISPLFHFLLFGWKEGRNPSPEFNTPYYLDTYPDVDKKGLNPLLHYIGKGWKEGRNPSPTFNSNKYIADNPGILFSDINPLSHKRTTNDKLLVEEEIIRFTEKRHRHILHKHVAVIIPVYLTNEGAIEALELLLHSLCTSYPEPKKNLSFTVIDDASPIGNCKQLLLKNEFLNRNDVHFLENDQNLGFTRTINRGIKQATKRSDIVILNSDTEIHGKIFEILQGACYRKPHIGSVTPLSNRSTISSLINWPFGAESIYDLTPKETSELIEKTGLIGPSSGAPTGHGFCMYMSRKAIKDVGHFDAETFGQGYGEENDWSMRAIKAGYTHHICTECFVFHHESKSFKPSQKSRLQRENSKKLDLTYPYYTEMVQKYLREDPSRQHRKLLRLFLLETQKKKKGLQTICIIIHDSYTNHAGGVQQHVKHLLNSLLNGLNQFELMVISPTTFKGNSYELHLFHQKEAIVLTNLEESFLTQILPHLKDRVDFLHVHHVHGLQQLLLDWIIDVKVQRKVLTIHDYDFFCSNPFLLNDNGEFCLAQENKEACSDKSCLKTKEKNRQILNAFDLLLAPSTNCKNYISEITKNKSIERKLHTLPHFLPFTDEITAIPSQDKSNALSKNIIFLGSLYPHKGGDVFLDSVESIETAGFTAQIWGHAQKALVAKYAQIPPIVPYKNWRELLDLYLVYGVHIVVIPAVCAETFSYTLFEALFLFEAPVITGPYGNPSEVVQQHGVGQVLTNTTPTELVNSIEKISNNYEYYLSAVKTYKKKYFSEFSKYHYIKQYSKIVFGRELSVTPNVQPSDHSIPAPLSHESKAIMNKALQLKAKEKLHVLFIHTLSAQDPPYFFRIENPLKYLEQSGCKVDIYDLDNAPLTVDKYDLIYLSRTPLTDSLTVFLKNAKANEIPTILDVDDLIFHTDFLKHFYFLGDSSDDFGRYQRLLTGLEQTFNRTDILLGSTPGIAAMGEEYGKKSIYFRNRLRRASLEKYKNLYQTRPQFKEQVIGYFAGSNTHEKDLKMLTPVLEKIFEKYPEAKLLLMGFVGNASFITQHPDKIIIEKFDNYDKYLETVRNCKIIIAPIAEINEFSQAKSSIKFLEAAAVGTPVVSSPIDEMIYCIEDGVTGWLANNDQEWLVKITSALSGDYAEHVGESANAYVMERFTDGSLSFLNLLTVLGNEKKLVQP